MRFIQLTLFFMMCFFMLKAQDTTQLAQLPRIVVFDWEMNGDSLNSNDGLVIASSIRTKLVNAKCSSKISILEREDIIKLLSEKSYADKIPDVFDKNTAIKLGKMLQANYVVFGKMTKSTLFDDYRISARMVEIESGNIIGATEVKYKSKNDYDTSITKITIDIIKSDNEFEQLFCIEEGVRKVVSYKNPMSDGIEEIVRNYDNAQLTVDVIKDRSNNYRVENAKAHPMINSLTQDIALILIQSQDDCTILINEDGFYWKITDEYGYEDQTGGFIWKQIKGIKIKREKGKHLKIRGDKLTYKDEDVLDDIERLIRQLENYVVSYKK